MTHAIKIEGWAWDAPCEWAGQYVETFDHDACPGGDGTFTPDIARAMHFQDSGAALEFWRKINTIVPTRPDGKPNRPMTAFTVSVVPVQTTEKPTDV